MPDFAGQMAGMEQIAGLALQQTLSPQMQQSLNILQAPLTELRQMVDTELRENPALEEVAPEGPEAETESPGGGLNDEWNEYFSQRAVAEPWSREALEKRQHFFDSQVRPVSLQEHLLEQLLTASWPKEEAPTTTARPLSWSAAATISAADAERPSISTTSGRS